MDLFVSDTYSDFRGTWKLNFFWPKSEYCIEFEAWGVYFFWGFHHLFPSGKELHVTNEYRIEPMKLVLVIYELKHVQTTIKNSNY
jgi:hypothetical protein